MMNENEILDDALDPEEHADKPKNINYTKYSITYIFLMLLIGSLLTKVMSGFDRSYFYLIVGAFSYIVIAFILALIQQGINLLYRKFVKKASEKMPEHPIWFRLLESCFYTWCVIVLVTFVGNKVI